MTKFMTNNNLLPILLFLLVAISLSCTNNYQAKSSLKFNSKVWKKASREDRGSMLSDLLGINTVSFATNVPLSHKLDAKTKEDILELLGKPDLDLDSGGMTPEIEFASLFYYYVGNLGRADPTGLRGECALSIYFDKNDLLVAIEIAN